MSIAVLGGSLAGTYLALKLKEKYPQEEVVVLEIENKFERVL